MKRIAASRLPLLRYVNGGCTPTGRKDGNRVKLNNKNIWAM